MKMQLTVLGERLAVASAAANVCSLKNPGNDKPRADKPPTRRKLRRESPVQSRDDPVTRSSMVLYLRAKVGRGMVGRRVAPRTDAIRRRDRLCLKPDVFSEKVNR